MKTPFTYLIGWPDLNLWYYGVRYAKGCHPKDLMTTYFTSSKYVHAIIAKHGLPPVARSRRTFKTAKAALIWEQKVLRRLKVLGESKWLNKSIGGAVYYDEEVLAKMREAKLGLKAVKKDGKHIMVAEALVETYLSQGYELGIARDMSGENNPFWKGTMSAEARKKISDASKLRIYSKETREKHRQNMIRDGNPMDRPGVKEKHQAALDARRKKVHDGERIHASIQDAAKWHDIPIYTVQYRASGERNGWSYK
jgi:hypothetical protein